MLKVYMKRLNFRPTGGTVVVQPTEGFAYKTQFRITLDDSWEYDGESRLKYRFWGRKKQGGHRFRIDEMTYDYDKRNGKHSTWM